MDCIPLSAERAYALDHASRFRMSAARMRMSSLRYGGAQGFETMAATFLTYVEMVEACADTDNPLAGAASLAEMQAAQCGPGNPASLVWRAVAELIRFQLGLICLGPCPRHQRPDASGTTPE